MTFYEKQLQLAEELASLASKGFMIKVREIAEALSICPKEDIKQISEILNCAVEAMEQADKEVAYYKEKIEEEERASNELLSM